MSGALLAKQTPPAGTIYSGARMTEVVLWMNVVGDLLIAMAYFTIPFALLYIARRRRDLSFDWLVVCFGVFVVACGLTYVIDVWNVWDGHYWLRGVLTRLT